MAFLDALTKRKLVDDWNKFLTWASTWAFIVAGSIQTTWVAMPEEMKAQVPSGLVYWATMGVLVFGVVGRVTEPKK